MANLDLELRLLPPWIPVDHSDCSHLKNDEIGNKSPKNEKLTIVYNGMVSSCDVTEFEARAIISYAVHETESRSTSPTPNIIGSDPVMVLRRSPTSNLSMKRSLQGFLLKRKNRIRSTSPYHHQQQHKL